MDTKEKIKEYIKEITRGLIKLQDHQAEDLMLICSNQLLGIVNFYRYSYNVSSGIPTPIFNKKIEVEEIKIIDIISKNLDKTIIPPDSKLYYKYECLDSKGVLKGTLYTSNNCLF